ncbi:hypothetical protein ACQ4PT_039611 [Festuca glaucescens]
MSGKHAAKRRHVDLGSAVATASTGVVAATVSPSTDVLYEILSWLPVKSLCRFMSVSKQWCALISDPAFVVVQESRAEPLLVGSNGSSLWLMDMDGNVVRRMKGLAGRLRFSPTLACFDDLACFADGSPDPRVIDLATGDMLFTGLNLEQQIDANLDEIFCHPWYSFGFGRTALSRLYKVVRVTECPPHTIGQIQQICYVLTIGDGAGWRKTRPPTTQVTLGYRETTVTIDGVMYFLVAHKNKFLCFDLETEEWNREIDGPLVYISKREAVGHQHSRAKRRLVRCSNEGAHGRRPSTIH